LRSLPPALRVYVLSVIAAGIVLLVVLRPVVTAATLPGVAFFVLLAFVAEMLPVPLPNREATISVGFVVIYASILLFGPREGAWIAALGTIRLKDLSGRVKPYMVLFNRALLGICGGLAGLVYLWTGGVPYIVVGAGPLIPAVLAGIVYITVNTVLMVGVMALHSKVSPVRMFLENFRWMLPNLVVYEPLGIMLAQVYLSQGRPAVALFLVPLLVARYSFQLYIKMRTAYVETISTLTASLDAKDPSTLGHSERVARYATEIGRKMGLDYQQLDLLRYVGILHDIGKIGIRDAILKKPGRFTAEEYEEMKKHPALGAGIIAGIKSLGSAASWVRHHHERYDGNGFPDNLQDGAIPLGARIIAVADSLDAITSKRVYKPAMSWDTAVSEMQRCSGTQFDPEVVRVFVSVVDALKPDEPSPQVAEVQTARRQAAATKGGDEA
jgi:uncharacterized membrane protein